MKISLSAAISSEFSPPRLTFTRLLVVGPRSRLHLPYPHCVMSRPSTLHPPHAPYPGHQYMVTSSRTEAQQALLFRQPIFIYGLSGRSDCHAAVTRRTVKKLVMSDYIIIFLSHGHSRLAMRIRNGWSLKWLVKAAASYTVIHGITRIAVGHYKLTVI